VIAAAGAAIGAEPPLKKTQARQLVAYFSRSGNTKVVAGTLQRALGAHLFEIRRASPYPDDYLATVEEATRERDRAVEPPLAELVDNIGEYENVYLGFPIWGETAPAVIRSFLKRHDLAGKTIVPFITHGGYGLGASLAIVKRCAPKATVLEAFSIEADQERRTMNAVLGWLNDQK
jgi:flavodoxin